MSNISSLAHRFANGTRGAIAVIFGISLIVLLGCTALAVDSSRLYNIQTKVQAALDAAALAGAKVLDQEGSVSKAKAASEAMWKAQLARISMDGLVLSNFVASPIPASSTVNVAVKVKLPSSFGKISGLNGEFDFKPTANASMKSMKIELSLVLDITGSMAANGKLNALKTAAKDLVDGLYASSPYAGQVRLALIPYSASVNAGSYFNPVTFGFHLDTCVVERAGGYSYTDNLPGWGTYLGTSSLFANPNYSCPAAKVVPLTDLSIPSDRTSFKNSIDAMQPNGGTAGHIGLAWGWYALSTNWASIWPTKSDPKPASPDIMKVIVLMTDGDFNTSYANGNLNSTDYTAVGSSGYQTLQLCNNINDTEVNIFTVAFMAPTNAEEMLKSCSGVDNFYNADDNATLVTVFKDIAERLSKLRVTS